METPTHIPVEPFTDEELEKIESTIEHSHFYLPNTAGEYLRKRDLAIIKLAACTGMRPAEVLTLSWIDIDFKKKRIIIYPLTNKERAYGHIILTKKAESILREYKEHFDLTIRSQFVFPSLLTMEPITTSGFGKRFTNLLKEAKVHKVIWITSTGQPISNRTMYSLRKHYGTKIYKKTKDIYLAMRALRHTRPKSTLPYIFYSQDEMKKELDKVF